jgi:cellobiose phosphorylase
VCREATYVITVKNGGGKGARLTVDGVPIEGNVIPYAPAGSVVTVSCDV